MNKKHTLRRILLSIALSLIIVLSIYLIVADSASSDSADKTEWRAYGRSSSGNRYYPMGISTNISTLNVVTYTMPASVATGISVANGFLYFGSGTGNKLFQMNFSNFTQQIANFSASGNVNYVPALANGYVYFSGGNYIHQVNATDISQQIANFSAGTAAYAPIVVGDSVYFMTSSVVYQLNSSNVSQEIARYTSSNLGGVPAFSGNSIYVRETSTTYMMRQLNASNISQQIASYSNGGRYIDSSVSVSNGYAYACTTRFLMQQNATNISKSIGSYTFSPGSSLDCYLNPVSAANSVYFAGTTGYLYQVNETNISQLIGTFNTGTIYDDSWIVATNTSIFVGTSSGYLYQLNASNITNQIGRYNLGATVTGPTIVNGRILFSKRTTALYEINATDDITDLVYPIFSSYADDSATLTDSGVGFFNVSIINTNGTVWLNVNNTNIFATNLGDNVFNVSYNFTRKGTYNYTWYSYGNGTSQNINNSGIRSYIVNSGPVSEIGLSVLSPSGNTNVTQNRFFNVSVNVSCSVVNCGQINVSLDPVSTKAVYNFTNGIQNFTVPEGVTSINIKVWGAGGGGGWLLTPYSGGAGGFASGDLNVTAGQVLYLVVGGGGMGARNSTGMSLGGYGGGGNSCSSTYPHGGGAGGGYSGVFNASTINQTNALIIAGGGGGGRSYSGTRSGGGGGTVGGGGNAGGGTQSAGGAGGVSGSALQGGGASSCSGSDGADGPGGGGGYYGGGGYPTSDGGDSGGGSGYLKSAIMNGSLVQGSNSTGTSAVNPPNTTDLDYANNAGVSGAASTTSGASGTNGSNGLIVISYTPSAIASKSGLVSMGLGATPFYTTTQNPYNLTLNKGESAIVTWMVNATGAINNTYQFFVYANQTSDMTLGNITPKWNVTIVNFTIDSNPPTISLISPINNTGSYENITFIYNATDESNISSCSLYINNILNQTNSTIAVSATSTFLLNNLVPAGYNWKINCTDQYGNTGTSETRKFAVIKNNFSGSTTNLSNQSITNISNLVIDSPASGKIHFLNTVDLSSGADIDSYVNISSNRIEINSEVLTALNSSARLYLYNLNFTNPQILKNGEICSSCSQESYSGGTLVFNVTGFSYYSAQEIPSNSSAPSNGTANPSGGSSGAGSSGGHVYHQCEKDSACSKGYVCYSYKCVKLFDIKVLSVQSPIQQKEFFNFSYYMKGMAEIKGDVIVKFWLENNNKKVTEGQDTIYLGVLEEKNETSSLFLPSEIDNGIYRFYVQVNFENYSAESYKDIEVIRTKNGIEIIPAADRPKAIVKQVYIIYILVALMIIFILVISIKKLKISEFKEKVSEAPLQLKPKLNTQKSQKDETVLSETENRIIELTQPKISGMVGKKVYTLDGNFIGTINEAYLKGYGVYGWVIDTTRELKRRFGKDILIKHRDIYSVSEAIILGREISNYLQEN